MKKSFTLSLFAMLIILTFSGGGFGKEDYRLRKKIRAFVKQKRFEEAIALYLEAAEKAENEIDKSELIKKASEIVMTGLKDYDRAMELALKIKDPGYSQSQQLALMVDNKKYKEAVEKFKDVDIETWNFDCRLKGYYDRGMAYYYLNDFENAVADLSKATETNGKVIYSGNACSVLGNIYLQKLNDEENALIAYEKGLKLTKANYAWRCHCFLTKVSLLVKQGKLDEAAKEFDSIDYTKFASDYWRGRFYLSQGDVLMKQGSNGQAATVLTKVLQTAGTSETQKKEAQKMIDIIIGSMSAK